MTPHQRERRMALQRRRRARRLAKPAIIVALVMLMLTAGAGRALATWGADIDPVQAPVEVVSDR